MMSLKSPVFLTILALSIWASYARVVPKTDMSSTYTLNKGEEKVNVQRVEVEQVSTKEKGQTLRECHGIKRFFSNSTANQFKLDWSKCPIMEGVDTIQLTIFYTKSRHPGAKEHRFRVEYHSQETIKKDYTIDMNLHGASGEEMRRMKHDGEKAEGGEEARRANEVETGEEEENGGGLKRWRFTGDAERNGRIGKGSETEEAMKKAAEGKKEKEEERKADGMGLEGGVKKVEEEVEGKKKEEETDEEEEKKKMEGKKKEEERMEGSRGEDVAKVGAEMKSQKPLREEPKNEGVEERKEVEGKNQRVGSI